MLGAFLIFFLMACACILRSFCLLDLLLQRLYHVYPDLWKAYGSPIGGFTFRPKAEKKLRWWEWDEAWKPIASRNKFMQYILDPKNELPDWINEMPKMVETVKKFRLYYRVSFIAMICAVASFFLGLLIDGVS